MSAKKYQALSPDGITLEFGVSNYTSKKKMFEAFDNWKKRFTQQGYYSSATYGRIPLADLEDYCSFRLL